VTPARGRIGGDGVELAYGAWPGDGAPIVAIHGLTASHMNFAAVAARVAGRRPLFAVDLRGRGDSSWAPASRDARGASHDDSIDQHARDLACAMRERRLGKSIVVGHSLGAYIACALAAAAPELVAGVMLVDGGMVAEPPPGFSLDGVMQAIYPSMVSRLGHTYASRAACVASWRRLPMFEPGDWNEHLEAFIDYDLGGAPPSLRSKIHEPAVRADFFAMGDGAAVEARLRRVHAPVSIVRAEWGLLRRQPPLIGDALVARMRSLVPAAVDDERARGTTHYTLALSEPGVSLLADRLVRFATSLGR
jgi:lipase